MSCYKNKSPTLGHGGLLGILVVTLWNIRLSNDDHQLGPRAESPSHVSCCNCHELWEENVEENKNQMTYSGALAQETWSRSMLMYLSMQSNCHEPHVRWLGVTWVCFSALQRSCYSRFMLLAHWVLTQWCASFTLLNIWFAIESSSTRIVSTWPTLWITMVIPLELIWTSKPRK